MTSYAQARDLLRKQAAQAIRKTSTTTEARQQVAEARKAHTAVLAHVLKRTYGLS